MPNELICAVVLQTSIFPLLYKTMENGMIDLTLAYALTLFDEKVIDSIIEEELSIFEKKEIIMSLDEDSKRLILRKLGFNREFLKTI